MSVPESQRHDLAAAHRRIREVDHAPQRPAVDDRDTIGDPLDLIQHVAREEDGLAARAAIAEQAEEGVAHQRIEAAGRLVEDQQLRLVLERERDPDHLPHAGRVALRPSSERGAREAEAIERLVAPFRRPLFEAGKKGERLLAGQAGGQREIAGQEAEATAQLAAALPHRDSEHGGAAAIGPEQVEQHADCRGLAGAVGAEETEDFAAPDREIDVADAGAAPPIERERVRFDRERGRFHGVCFYNPAPMSKRPTRIDQLFGRGEPVISFEFFPPKTADAETQLFDALAKLRPLAPAFVSVTYGAGGSTREKTVELVGRIRREWDLLPLAHLTCVGATREETKGVLERLAANGIENILALRGDPPKGAAAFTATPGGFRYANELAACVADDGRFAIGGACYPEGHPECRDLALGVDHLTQKVAAGARFLITQLFFEPKVYFDFVARARQAGITVPIVPGVMPVTNVDQLERFTQMCGATIPRELAERLARVKDDPQVVLNIGIDHATQQCADLLRGGAPGIHFYTLNKSPSARAVFENLRHRGLVGRAG